MSAPEGNPPSVASTVVVTNTGTTPSDRGTLPPDSVPTSGTSVLFGGSVTAPKAVATGNTAAGDDLSPVSYPKDLQPKRNFHSSSEERGSMRQPSIKNSPPAKELLGSTRPRSTDASSDEVEFLGESRPTTAAATTTAKAGSGSAQQQEKVSPGGSTTTPSTNNKKASNATAATAAPAANAGPQKEKIQTKFTFGLKKDREPELLRQIDDKDKIIADKTRLLQEMTERCAYLEAENQRLKNQCERASEERGEEEERIQRYQSVLKEAMLEAARAHRRDSRRYISDNHFNLGQVVTVQTGMGAQDMWVHGNQYREIHDEIARLKERLAECEAAKKDAQSEKRSLAVKNKKQAQKWEQQAQLAAQQGPAAATAGGGGNNSGDDIPPGLSPLNPDGTSGDADGTSQGFLHPNDALRAGRGVPLKIVSNDYLAAETQADIHTLEIAKIRAEIEEKEAQRREIDLKRLPFLKECTRVREEDSSAFAHVPMLGPVVPNDEEETVSPHHANASLYTAPLPTKTMDRYVLMHLLGKGGFSEVWKAFDIVEGRHVALKIHAVDKNWQLDVKQSFFKHIRREFEIQKTINHEQVVKLYDVFNVNDGRNRKPGEETCVSVMEYCSGTDLDTELKKSGTIKEHKARLMLRQILAGLTALHENGVIHYDLKPANILFTTDLSTCLNIKITDFGLSKQVSNQGNMGSSAQIELTSQGTGTFWYLPPECFQKGKVNIGYEVDVWAVGVVFFQMLYGKKPFADKNSQREIWNGGLIPSQAKSGVEFPPDPANCKKEDRISDGAKRFIELCLQENPKDRPTAAALARDPYCSPPTGTKRSRNLTDPSPGDDLRPIAPNLRSLNRD